MKLPKSIKKYIRFKKSIIRKESLSKKDNDKKIGELYQKFNKNK